MGRNLKLSFVDENIVLRIVFIFSYFPEALRLSSLVNTAAAKLGVLKLRRQNEIWQIGIFSRKTATPSTFWNVFFAVTSQNWAGFAFLFFFFGGGGLHFLFTIWQKLISSTCWRRNNYSLFLQQKNSMFSPLFTTPCENRCHSGAKQSQHCGPCHSNRSH